MIQKKFKIDNEEGVHARPATSLVKACMQFDCQISLTALHRTVDFKSVMGVLSLGIFNGTEIEVVCSGIDEKEAMDEISKLICGLNLGQETKGGE